MKDLSSERLVLRSPREEDAPFITKLMNSKGYLTNIGERGVKSSKDAADYLRSAPIYDRDDGLGFNIVELEGRPIGICGLVKRDAYQHPDVGYAFLDECAGRGLATEAAGAVVAHAFEGLGLTKLLAITAAANAASRRVLEKLGFALSSSSEEGVCVYRITNGGRRPELSKDG